MPRTFGAATLPFAVPADGEAVTDPCLDILAESFTAILESNAGAAWAAVSPGEPLVRKTLKHDPVVDFNPNDLPALYVYRDDERRPRRETLADLSFQSTIFVRYVHAPTSSSPVRGKRDPIFNAFNCLGQLVYQDRDPAWKHPSEELDPDEVGITAREKVVRQACAAYGSSIQDHAGIDYWELQDIARGVIRIEKVPYYTVDMRILIVESGRTEILSGTSPEAIADRAANGVAVSQIDLVLNTGGDTPLDTQHTREPDLP